MCYFQTLCWVWKLDFYSRKTWDTAAPSNSKHYSVMQCDTIFSVLLKYNFFCLISKYSVKKRLQVTRALPNNNQHSQDCPATLSATFISNTENNSFCKSTTRTWDVFKKRLPNLPATPGKPLFWPLDVSSSSSSDAATTERETSVPDLKSLKWH